MPNPLAKNPNFHTHKVFAAIGIILAGTVLVLFGLALIYHINLADLFSSSPASDNTKVSTPSAKPLTATNSATKNETANWKTYIDQYKTFSIKHPPEFYETKSTYDDTSKVNVSLLRKDGGALTNFLPATRGPNKDGEMSITFDILAKNQSETLKNFVNRWINLNIGEFAPGNVDSNLKETLTVDGKSSLFYQGNLGPSVEHVEVYIPKNDTKVVRVTIYANKSQLPTSDQITLLKEMLSTFKFL